MLSGEPVAAKDTEETLSRLTREDVREFLARCLYRKEGAPVLTCEELSQLPFLEDKAEDDNDDDLIREWCQFLFCAPQIEVPTSILVLSR